MSGEYNFKVVFSSSGSEIENVHYFNVVVITEGFAAYGATTIIGTTATDPIDGNMIIATGSIISEPEYQVYNKLSNNMVISGCFVFDSVFATWGMINPEGIS